MESAVQHRAFLNWYVVVARRIITEDCDGKARMPGTKVYSRRESSPLLLTNERPRWNHRNELSINSVPVGCVIRFVYSRQRHPSGRDLGRHQRKPANHLEQPSPLWTDERGAEKT